MAADNVNSLEAQIEQWRSYLRRRQAIHSVDVAELEDHLREQVANLVESGLATDEAFLIAVKRMGSLDALSREFAREHSERLWKQLVVTTSDGAVPPSVARNDAATAVAFAAAAACAIKVPELFGKHLSEVEGFYAHNIPLFVLPLLTGYFAWKRRLTTSMAGMLGLLVVVAAVFANVYPLVPNGSTDILSSIHMPILLVLLVGVAYAGARWKEVAGRMDFIRFSGELAIYYVLIALGGGVLTAFLLMIFETIGIKAESFVQSWLVPCGAVGAVIIASWLVEAKQSVIENMAPVLTRLFTPMFAAVLLAFLAALLWTGGGSAIDRNMLIAFDALLVLVLALLLYSISARSVGAAASAFDFMQVVLVISALLADLVALWAIATRINEFGFTPNRIAILGINLILLVNLAVSAALYVDFLRDRVRFAAIERWQTNYLPVYGAWAAIVVIVFPPLFGYV